MKLALCMICKPSDDEADLLKQCLTYAAPIVDGIFVTITGNNKKCEEVVTAFGGHFATCEWEHDFAKARNFALSRVPKEYDYWMWLDTDDAIRGGENLRKHIEDNPSTDCFIMNYLYAFDEWKNPVVTHLKTRVIRHDGCVEWAGKLHEDFKENRKVDAKLIQDVEVLHLSTPERFEKAKERNLEVSEKALIGLEDDPRAYWNLGNSQKALMKHKEALESFNKFMQGSKSDEEKYIVLQRIAEIYLLEKEYDKALDSIRYAIGLRPNYPDAYIMAGNIFFELKRWDEAKSSYITALEKPVPYHKIIVFNPRAYDYEPLMSLAKVYFNLSLPNLALECLKACKKIMPKNENIKNLIKNITKEAKLVDEVLKKVEEYKDIEDDNVLKEKLDALPVEMQQHPHICHLRNIRFIKTESSGRDLVYFCGYTADEWNPKIAEETGIGGSEEAVINLTKELAKKGWNITVYNNCGHKEQVFDGVTYKPYWAWNPRDKQDVTILWRVPKFADYGINTGKLFVDLHDVIGSGEFNEKRLDVIDGVFFKSMAHRKLFPNVPDEKVTIVPNGIHWEHFQQGVEKDPFLIINTSSPDRSIKTLVNAFKRVKEAVPQAHLKWAYGWNVWDNSFAGDAERRQWKEEVEKAIAECDGFETLGRIGHKEIAKLYQEASIFAYPTAFFEIDCISARKAQAAGAYPVSTDFAALDETIQYGAKVHVDPEKENWGKPYKFDFGLQDKRAVDEWVEKCIEALGNDKKENDMREWTKQFDWTEIANKWNEKLYGHTTE